MAGTPWNKGISKYKPKPCLCGCGELLKVHAYPKANGQGFTYMVNDFIKGHGKRGAGGFLAKVHSSRLCACGCGTATVKHKGRFNRFIKGHENRGRTSWNKGKGFSGASRAKMSLARLGKEPANKACIDVVKLRALYIQEEKTALLVSKELGVPLDAVKNRLRALGWSRSTKESCATQAFKERMREIRVKVLASPKKVETPNKLERLVYDTLDALGVSYQKQVPLFGKFVVDVLFPERNVVLEIFGRYWHEMPAIKKKDSSKKKYLEKCGYQVEEIWDNEIRKEGVPVVLGRVLRKYEIV